MSETELDNRKRNGYYGDREDHHKVAADDVTMSNKIASKKVLQPFVHQVSGRAHMLSLNQTTMCKSLSFREWNFYLELPATLLEFTPQLKGLLYVLLEKDNDNSHRFTSSGMWVPPLSANNNLIRVSLNSEADDKNSSRSDTTDQQRLHDTVFKGLDRLKYPDSSGFTSHPWTVDKDQEAVTEARGKNPWSLRQHWREINRTLKGDLLRKEIDLNLLWDTTARQLSQSQKGELVSMFEKIRIKGNFMKAYLLLEDVTSRYEFPSILDLKIGTQLDRDGCSQAKKDKHFNLVKRSSTGSVGLRIAGMQVFQVTTDQYLCRDKYYGRGLSTDGFKQTLYQFLHNGREIVSDVIPPMVERLRKLRQELKTLDSFRFYASSVLLSYEGAESRRESGPTSHNISQSSCNSNRKTRREVGVHMIDFAHSTFHGFLDDKATYQGPDNDCLIALDNLVELLSEIERTSICPNRQGQTVGK